MTARSSRREAELEAENERLRTELAAAESRAAKKADVRTHELADARTDLASSEALNTELRRANAELEESERHRDLLLAELNHRVKNILATVQGLAAQTLKGVGGDPRRFARHFGARLRTLARAHDMLAAGGWEPAGIEDTARVALVPWLGTGRAIQLNISGGCLGVMVSPRQAQALVLAFHELATNATKYGALSVSEGHVETRCEVGADGAMTIHWAEADGPPVVGPPDRRGFGTRLLERGLAMDLGPGSSVELHFEPAGLQAAIRFIPTQRPQWPLNRHRSA
ncbi:sensor histidine kinase [Belnapia sp. F-4-1]|uniref:sensor histidine kinase n=1 Tax=Belnapia sp. F-4-1 TaxID=1545443 RepID=UPI0006921BFE|nr:HWE histidine kinase domain-containing protein [Belnapia sp. F-4-1]